MTQQERQTLANLKRERQQQLAHQLALNAGIRRRWVEADHIEARQGRVGNDGAILADRLRRARLPFKAVQVSLSPVLWITSWLLAWRNQRAQSLAAAAVKPVSALTAFFSHMFNSGQHRTHDQPIMNTQTVIIQK